MLRVPRYVLVYKLLHTSVTYHANLANRFTFRIPSRTKQLPWHYKNGYVPAEKKKMFQVTLKFRE
jgi:hypothetical protein